MAMKFVGAAEVAEILGISKSSAYRIIGKLNKELEAKGYIVISGRVSEQYLSERFYGGWEQTEAPDNKDRRNRK